MLLSIVIPAKNEEKYLPILLRSIKKQTFKDYEIIVADNNSADETRFIAEKSGCRVTDGGLPGVGRNKGAKIAKGEIILFLDADTVLREENFLEKALAEFQAKKFCCASLFSKTDTGGTGDRIFDAAGKLLRYFSAAAKLPILGGYCIFVRKNIHEKLNGFDEKIFLGEDTDYGLRISRVCKTGILGSAEIVISARRFKKEGYIKVLLQCAGYVIYHYVLGREDKTNKFNYNFDIYGKKDRK